MEVAEIPVTKFTELSVSLHLSGENEEQNKTKDYILYILTSVKYIEAKMYQCKKVLFYFLIINHGPG